MSKSRIIDKHFTAHLKNDGIIHLEVKENHMLTLTDTIRVTDAFKIIGGGEKYPILISGGCGASSADHEARQYSASDEGIKYTLADAILAKSMAQMLLANFYLKFYPLNIPTKVFKEYEKAVEWLKGFID